VGVAAHRGAVDAQFARRCGAQEPAEGGLGLESSCQLGAFARRERVGGGDVVLEASDDLGADLGVASNLVGVVADDEAIAGPRRRRRAPA